MPPGSAAASIRATGVIAAVTAGKSFADFDGDIVLRSAVERQFEIIGEALAQLARIDAAMAQKVPRSSPFATS